MSCSIGFVNPVWLIKTKKIGGIENMCGLAGIVGEVDLMEQVLLHMSAAQNHRGKETPNSWVSSFIDARVGLMHNLSLIHI